MRTSLFALTAALFLGLLPACGGETQADEKKKDGDTPTTGDAKPGNIEPAPPAELVKRPNPETVVVTINGKDVTQGEIDEIMNRQFGRGRMLNVEQLNQIAKQYGPRLEEQIIVDTLLEDAVVEEGIIVTDEDVAADWAEIEKRIPAGMTIDTMLARNGMTRESADKEVRKQSTRRKLFEKMVPTEDITDEAARKHYDDNVAQFKTKEEVKARHVLVKTQGDSPEQKKEKRKKIEEIRAKLVASEGSNFPEIAAAESACPSGKQAGGSLGFFGRGQMVPEFDKTAFSLKVGEISEIIETNFGYHVIQLEDKHEAGTKPFEKVSESIKKQLGERGRKAKIDAYVESLKAAATIVRPGAPSEDKPAETTPADKSAEDRPAEDKPATDAPAEPKPADKPADKPAEETKSADKPAKEAKPEEKPTEEKPASDTPK